METNSARRRRPHNQVKNAIREYLGTLDDQTASIPQIRQGTKAVVGEAAASTYRSTLQDERVFTRVSRGVFRLNEQ